MAPQGLVAEVPHRPLRLPQQITAFLETMPGPFGHIGGELLHRDTLRLLPVALRLAAVAHGDNEPHNVLVVHAALSLRELAVHLFDEHDRFRVLPAVVVVGGDLVVHSVDQRAIRNHWCVLPAQSLQGAVLGGAQQDDYAPTAIAPAVGEIAVVAVSVPVGGEVVLHHDRRGLALEDHVGDVGPVAVG